MSFKAKKIEEKLKSLFENLNQNDFIYELLAIYDFPKATITRLKNGINQLAKEQGQFIVKNRICFQEVFDKDLHIKLDDLQKAPEVIQNGSSLYHLTWKTRCLIVYKLSH